MVCWLASFVVSAAVKLTDTYVQARIGEVRGRMPETGHEFIREGLFLEEAEGMSLAQIVSKIKNPSLLQEIFRRANSSQVCIPQFTLFMLLRLFFHSF